MAESTENSETAIRILDAAIELFAQQGYRRTTVRQIIDAAGVNLGSVNYHFGGKEKLYHAALDRARQQSNETNAIVQTDTARDFHRDEPPQRRLYLHVRTLLEHMFRDGQPTAMTRLMQQELIAPTAALDRLVEQSVRRVQAGLDEIVVSLSPRKLNKRRLRLTAISISGQVHAYHLLLPLIQRVHPDQRFAPKDLDQIARHITRFSLAGIQSAADYDESWA
ncbi:MAG: CerR family C-terminal domain-containing protein [Planctomycetota bacterium]